MLLTSFGCTENLIKWGKMLFYNQYKTEKQSQRSREVHAFEMGQKTFDQQKQKI